MASQLCGHAAMRPCGHAAMRPCGHAAMRPCGHAAIRPWPLLKKIRVFSQKSSHFIKKRLWPHSPNPEFSNRTWSEPDGKVRLTERTWRARVWNLKIKNIFSDAPAASDARRTFFLQKNHQARTSKMANFKKLLFSGELNFFCHTRRVWNWHSRARGSVNIQIIWTETEPCRTCWK